MSEPRTHFLDPDFRRQFSATDRICCRCSKKLADGKGVPIRISLDGMDAVHPEDATAENSVESLIGPECLKHVPEEFRQTYAPRKEGE